MKDLFRRVILVILGLFLSVFGTILIPFALLFFGSGAWFVMLLTPAGIFLLFQAFSSASTPPIQFKIPNIPKISKPKNQDQYLHDVFYDLLEKNNGLVTVLNLASQARVGGKVAEKFLQEKVKEFNHKVIIGPDGEIAYKFEYLNKSDINFLSS